MANRLIELPLMYENPAAAFTIFQGDAGTSLVADSANDTATFTSSDGSILITGDSSTDTMNFTVGSPINGFTQGSVLFADSSGEISQDNSNFFWDDTNNRLRIANSSFTSAKAKLEIRSVDDLDATDILACYANNLTQGFAVRYGGLYAIGSNANVNINIVAKSGNVVFNSGQFYIQGDSYSYHNGLRLGGGDSSNTIYSATSDIGITTNGGIQGISVGYTSSTFSVFNAGASDGTFAYNQYLRDTTAMAAGVGGGIAFVGDYGLGPAILSGIKGVKKNSSSGDFAGEVAIYTRLNGGSLLERLRVSDAGLLGLNISAPTAQLHLVNSSASQVAEIIKGAASQSSNLTEWQNSSGTVLASVSSAGVIAAPNIPVITATNISTTGSIHNRTVDTGWLVFTGSASVTLSGLVAQTDGYEVIITNRLSSSSFTVTILNENASSTAANRVTNPDGGSIVINRYQSHRLRYVAATSRWVSAVDFVSAGSIGSVPNASGFSVSGNVLTLQPASLSFGGVLTSGSQQITGYKEFFSGISAPSISAYSGSLCIDLNNKYLIRSTSSQSMDWENFYLYDQTPVLSANWNTRYLYDSTGTQSVVWEGRELSDSGGLTSCSWGGRFLADSSNQYSVQWEQRQLHDSSGIVTVDWQSRYLYDSSNTIVFNFGTQQTTAVTGATLTGGGGTTLTDTDTWDGYTVGQIVGALRAYGLLA
jgi:hypothetical protein